MPDFVWPPEARNPDLLFEELVLLQLDHLGHQLHDVKRILQQVRTNERHVMADLTQLTSAVEANTSVDESAIALLNQLSDLIRQNTDDPAALSALADQISSESSSLAAAVSANTPATAPPVEPPPVEPPVEP